MITCPFCQAPLAETAPACPRCNLDLQRVRNLLGPAPRLSFSGLSDLSLTLQPSDEKVILRACAGFAKRFPQSRIFVVLREFAPQYPLGLHLFWLFNSAGLSPEDRQRGNNRDILIGIDPARQVAGLIIGYGLEPFLTQTALERVVDCASPSLKLGKFAAGIEVMIDQLAQLMEGLCHELPAIVGLDETFVTEPSPADEY